MDATSPVILSLVVILTVAAFTVGWLLGRPSRVDQYGIDFGTMGKKKAPRGKRVYDGGYPFEIYETDFLYLNRYRYRHIMEVWVDFGAVSFTQGILLTSQESAKVDAQDDWDYFARLANDVQKNSFRYKSTPLEERSPSASSAR